MLLSFQRWQKPYEVKHPQKRSELQKIEKEIAFS